MVYMIADYKEHGVDCHNEFVVGGTEDQERAVDAVADELTKKGCDVQCITVCPDAESMQAIYDGKRPAGLFISYPFV